MSASLIILVIALAALIVSVILAIIQNGIGNPTLWAIWSIAIVVVIGQLAGAVGK